MKIEKPMATELSMLDKSAPSIFNECLDSVVEFCLYFCVIIVGYNHLFIQIRVNGGKV